MVIIIMAITASTNFPVGSFRYAASVDCRPDNKEKFSQ